MQLGQGKTELSVRGAHEASTSNLNCSLLSSRCWAAAREPLPAVHPAEHLRGRPAAKPSRQAHLERRCGNLLGQVGQEEEVVHLPQHAHQGRVEVHAQQALAPLLLPAQHCDLECHAYELSLRADERLQLPWQWTAVSGRAAHALCMSARQQTFPASLPLIKQQPLLTAARQAYSTRGNAREKGQLELLLGHVAHHGAPVLHRGCLIGCYILRTTITQSTLSCAVTDTLTASRPHKGSCSAAGDLLVANCAYSTDDAAKL